MPTVSGLEVHAAAEERGIAFKAIVLTMHADPNLAVEALKAGAPGFVLKESSGEELLTALDVVLRGGTYLAATGLTKEIVTLMVGGDRPESCRADDTAARDASVDRHGQRAKEIAATLQTVDAQRRGHQVQDDAAAQRPFDGGARPLRHRTSPGDVLMLNVAVAPSVSIRTPGQTG